MPGMGPPPKAPGTRARRNATLPMTRLPAAGRQGAAPAWSLPDDIAKQVTARRAAEKAEDLQDQLREDVNARTRAKFERQTDQALQLASVLEAEIAAQRVLEAALWATPQAAQWEALGWHRDVAQYVRHKVRGELGSLDDAKEARQWSDRLGLNPLAMLRLRWETERAEEAEERGRRRRAATSSVPAKAAKGRKAVDPRRVLAAVPDSA